MAGELQSQEELVQVKQGDLVLTWDRGAVLVGEVEGKLGSNVSVKEVLTQQVQPVDESKLIVLQEGFVYLSELGYIKEINKSYPANIRFGIDIGKVKKDLGVPEDHEVPTKVLEEYLFKQGVENKSVDKDEAQTSFAVISFLDFVQVLMVASMKEEERFQQTETLNREGVPFEKYKGTKTEKQEVPNNVVPFKRK
ncbi:hypothetical protein P9X10_01080 [Bacillus cereus]|nr:hypothetical protein [Bacillus cereus]